MSNISLAEILKIHGQWIGSKEFVLLVSQKLKITDRHAYNLIKKASDTDKSIIKITLENRKVIYRLPEFGSNESLPIANIEKGQRLGFFEWLKWRREYDDSKKEKESRKRKCEIALGWEKIWLNHQGFDDDEYQSRLDDSKAKLRKEYDLS